MAGDVSMRHLKLGLDSHTEEAGANKKQRKLESMKKQRASKKQRKQRKRRKKSK